jgi:hypothetical protein
MQPEEATMATRIRKVEYFYTTVQDRPGEAYRVLSGLADSGVNLLAMTAVPVGPMRTQLALFPADSAQLHGVAAHIGMTLDGPNHALLVQGDDQLGALKDVHQSLFDANVNVYAATGVTGGAGKFGYLLYIRPDELDRAVQALGI